MLSDRYHDRYRSRYYRCRRRPAFITRLQLQYIYLLSFTVRQDCSHSESKRLFQANKVPKKTVCSSTPKHDPTFRQTDQKTPNRTLFARLLLFFVFASLLYMYCRLSICSECHCKVSHCHACSRHPRSAISSPKCSRWQ